MKKKDCEHTRKNLGKYLRGHLFKPEMMKIERHLAKCALCKSELQALRCAAETRQYIKDITPAEGMVQRVKAGMFGLGGLRKLMYRPLWLLGIAAVLFFGYRYVVTPLLHDKELEGLETTAPVAAPVVPAPAPAAPPAPAAAQKKEETAAPALPRPDSIVITITAENEKEAMRRINEVMKGHALLRTLRFTDTNKEISGSLTAKELVTFFNRIESVGKISYGRAKLDSFPAGETLPFIIRLKAAPAAPRPAGKAVDKPVDKHAEKPVGGPVDKPVNTPVEKPAPAAATAQ